MKIWWKEEVQICGVEHLDYCINNEFNEKYSW